MTATRRNRPGGDVPGPCARPPALNGAPADPALSPHTRRLLRAGWEWADGQRKRGEGGVGVKEERGGRSSGGCCRAIGGACIVGGGTCILSHVPPPPPHTHQTRPARPWRSWTGPASLHPPSPAPSLGAAPSLASPPTLRRTRVPPTSDGRPPSQHRDSPVQTNLARHGGATWPGIGPTTYPPSSDHAPRPRPPDSRCSAIMMGYTALTSRRLRPRTSEGNSGS